MQMFELYGTSSVLWLVPFAMSSNSDLRGACSAAYGVF